MSNKFESPVINFCKKYREAVKNHVSYTFTSDGLNATIVSKFLGDDFWDVQTEKIYYSLQTGKFTYSRFSNSCLFNNEYFAMEKTLFEMLREDDFIQFSFVTKKERKKKIISYTATKKDLCKNAEVFQIPILKQIVLLRASNFEISTRVYNG